MKLFQSMRCPYSARVRAILDEKAAPCELVEVDLARKPAALLALDPKGGVPVLVEEDGFVVRQSSVIGEYLDARLDGPRLLPDDPRGRARVRLSIDACDADLAPALAKLLRGPVDEHAAARLAIGAVLDRLERDLAGPFVIGDFTLADVAWASHLLRLPVDVAPTEASHPRVAAWLARLRARPSLRRHMVAPRAV